MRATPWEPRRFRARFDFPIVGTVPAVKVAARASRRFTLLATPNTAHGAYSLGLIARFAASPSTSGGRDNGCASGPVKPFASNCF